MPRWDTFAAFLADAQQAPEGERQLLVDQLLAERPQFPWVEDTQATFIYNSAEVSRVAVNLDTIPSDPPFAPMTNLPGTTLWYVTREFAPDDLLDYMLAVDDPMTPLATEPDIAGRVAQFWQLDPRNSLRIKTAQMHVSVLRMNKARPFPDWASLENVRRGVVYEHNLDSGELGVIGRKLWVYTPPGYAGSGAAYPLLIFHDGQWGAGPLQTPFIADVLLKYRRLQPCVIAMIQSGTQEERNREYMTNERHYSFLLTELLPFVQTHYRIDSSSVGVGGVAVGAVAAAHAALKNPVVFSTLIMISPPLGKGPNQEQLQALVSRFQTDQMLPKRIFQSVGRYEAKGRFYKPALALRDRLLARRDTAYRFVETGSGHGLVGFRSVLPEALAWVLPGAVS